MKTITTDDKLVECICRYNFIPQWDILKITLETLEITSLTNSLVVNDFHLHKMTRKNYPSQRLRDRLGVCFEEKNCFNFIYLFYYFVDFLVSTPVFDCT